MKIVDRDTAAPAWLSQAELAQASGLREDLIGRFIPPAAHPPTGPMWSPHQLPLAVYVKELTNQNFPPAAIEKHVRGFISNPQPLASYPSAPAAKTAIKSSPRSVLTRLAVPLGCLIVGGLIGGVIGARTTTTEMRGPVASQTETPAGALAPTVPPTSPDPVCEQWAQIGDRGRAARAAWRAADANIPATRWSPAQRQLNLQLIEQLQGEAAELRQLANQARQPVLATVLTTGAAYEEAFAARIPTYTPADLVLWTAATDAANLANSLCQAVAPR